MEIALCGKHSGEVVLVDEVSLPIVSRYKWYKSTNGYATTTVHRKGFGRGELGRNLNLSMARLILGLSPGDGIGVDHINGDRLDNRSANLRTYTEGWQNKVNRKTPNKLGVRGVCQEGSQTFGIVNESGTREYYETLKDAALAADRVARHNYGRWVKLNYPEVTDYSNLKPKPKRNTGTRTSSTRGVSLSRCREGKTTAWRVVLKKKHLGWFATEADAIAFRDHYENQKCN